MSTTAISTVGTFVWHELMVPDVEKAKQFYGALFGWTFKDSRIGGANYTEIYAGDSAQGGMMALPEADQIPPHWMGYVSVNDVDAAAQAALDAGGQVLVSPTNIPNVGRFAVVTDPQGGAITPFQAASDDRPQDGPPAPNTFCWDQLNTEDPAAAIAFYAKVVGWNATSADGMTTFTQGDKMEASLVPAEDGMPTHWVSYVYVQDMEGTRTKAASLGAQVLVTEMAVPGIGRFSVLKDPQGAVICLFSDPSL